MTFDLTKINLQQLQYQCEYGGRRSVCVNTTVCFNFTVKSEQAGSTFAAGETNPHPKKKKKIPLDVVVL